MCNESGVHFRMTKIAFLVLPSLLNVNSCMIEDEKLMSKPASEKHSRASILSVLCLPNSRFSLGLGTRLSHFVCLLTS